MSGPELLGLRVVHVLSAVLFMGFGLASFFYKSVAARTRDPRVVLFCDRQIVLADWLFTVPAGIALPATGALLVWAYGLPWRTGWIMTGIAGYVVAGITWLPAARLQLVMRRIAARAHDAGAELPAEYDAALRAWKLLGVPSFAAALVSLSAMVAKWSLF